MQNAYHNLNDFSGRPIRTFNINAHFIASNPPTSFNPRSIYPRIHKTAFVGPLLVAVQYLLSWYNCKNEVK